MLRLSVLVVGLCLVSSAASAQIPAGQFPAVPGVPTAAPRDTPTPKTGTAKP
jgi:hypothetical protein